VTVTVALDRLRTLRVLHGPGHPAGAVCLSWRRSERRADAGVGERATPQRGQGAAHILLAHSDLAGDHGRVEWLVTGDLVGLVELLDAL
jgi:hypothetical protein